MNDSANPDYYIRQVTKSDAPEIARLLTVLEHPATAEEVLTRWEPWTAAGNVALAAVKADGKPAGVATLNKMFVLHRPKPVGRITAIVVDSPLQGSGIGRALINAAEDFLTDAGCGILEITSNLRLINAHDFYEHLGYKKTSIRFMKELDSNNR